MDGGSVAGTLFIVFLILKLTHTITWSWWWVTAPLWGDIALTLALFVLIAVGALGSFGIFKAFNRAGHARR
jgi:hypothetical protein